jgi:hypothetical protein
VFQLFYTSKQGTLKRMRRNYEDLNSVVIKQSECFFVSFFTPLSVVVPIRQIRRPFQMYTASLLESRKINSVALVPKRTILTE